MVEFAGSHHFVLTYEQLLDVGLRPGAIKYRAHAGHLYRLYQGVYAVGRRSLTREGRWLAAVRACGDDALLSHRDGAALHGLRRTARPKIDVTAPRSRHAPNGITLHRPRCLDPRDRTVSDGIPVTSVPRTLLDCATVLAPRQVERMIEEAERIRVFDRRAVEEMLDRSTGHHGCTVLARCLATAVEEGQHTREEMERLLIDVCRDGGVPLPVFNSSVEGYEVDAHWPGTLVIAELDSWAFHRTRAAFERDRARDLRLKLAGYTVVRITWRQLTEDPAAVARTLLTLLSGRAAA